MAKVHLSFTMDVPPDQAQDMFGRDIVPYICRDGGFGVRDDENGSLLLAEGPDYEGPPINVVELLRRKSFRHLKVSFKPERQGTCVTVEGHVPDEMKGGLEHLGTPGHWPEIASSPHD